MTLFLTETTLLYHHFRLAPSAAVAHPTSKSQSGIIADWAERVATAAKKPIAITSAPSRSSSEDVLVSVADSPLPRSPAYETGGLDKEVFETYVPGEQKGTVKHVSL